MTEEEKTAFAELQAKVDANSLMLALILARLDHDNKQIKSEVMLGMGQIVDANVVSTPGILEAMSDLKSICDRVS